MSIVKIANEGAERLVKDMPAPKPVYRIVLFGYRQCLIAPNGFYNNLYDKNGIVGICYRVK